MTVFVPAYDVESPNCLQACRKIVEIHREFDFPATFFIVGRILEANQYEYLDILGDSSFEVASHSYSHKMLMDHPFCGPAAPEDQIKKEILQGKVSVEKVFGRPCPGFRPACGFVYGLRGAQNMLRLISEAGYKYVSSMLWGPDFSMPAPLNSPFRYVDEGYPDIWELPAHGWHENLLKGNTVIDKRILLFPPLMPEMIPSTYVKTPEEEFKFNNKPMINRALAEDTPYVSLVWHPWSLNAFDPEMRMLKITFNYLKNISLQTMSFSEVLSTILKK